MRDVTAASTKVCPCCAETIKAAAKICPFCQSRLSRWALLGQDLGRLAVLLVLAGFALVVFAWLERDSSQPAGRRFVPHRNELIVERASLASKGKATAFWLSGFVSNRGTYPWRVRELEVRFLDRAGNLLDVRHCSVSDPFVVQPGREAAFRVDLGELPPAISQAQVSVRVHQAGDGNLPADPD